MSLTLTRTEQSAQRSERIAMNRQLDRPTPFTQRGKVKKRLQRSDVFSGKVKGVAGIYQRTRRRLKLLFAYKAEVKHEPQYGFREVAEKRVRQTLARNFTVAMGRALRSAR